MSPFCVRCLILSCAVIAAIAVPLAATSVCAGGGILHVDDDAVPGGDGQSWDTAFRFLRDALTVANTPGSGVSEVRVAQGTYRPDEDEANPEGTGDINQNFAIASELTLQGGYAGLGAADPDLYDPKQLITTLSGDLNGDDGPDFANYADNCLHVVTIQNTAEDTQLKGLTIYGGHAFGDGGWGLPDDFGAGVHSLDASLLIEECTFDRNWASVRGAGLYAPSGQVVIKGCSFMRNEVDDGWGGGAYVGQGMVSESLFFECIGPYYNSYSAGGLWCSNATISNCAFVDCVGSAVSCESGTTIASCQFAGNYGETGGALAILGDNVHVSNSTFLDNSATDVGAISQALGEGNCIVNCRFVGNGASNHATVFVYSGSMSLANCHFSGNEGLSASDSTYALPGGTAEVALIGCTFTLNFYGGVGANTGSTFDLSNCISWGNSHGAQIDENALQGLITYNYCCIQGWDGSLGGVGNDGLDPLFIDPDGADDIPGTLDDDCRLAADSPSRNAGNNNYLPPDTLDLDGDGDTSEPIPLDLDLLPRISQGTVDRGPYEFHPICAADLFPDVDGFGDGLIGPGDLAQLLVQWGQCDAEECTADIFPADAPDGIVGLGDLSELLVQWGACE